MKSKNKIILVFLFLLLILLTLISDVEAVYIGVVDGYVKDIDGNIVSEALVTATIVNCSSGGCSVKGVSDNNGYYVVNNLNSPKGGRLTVNAVKGFYSGSAVGNADEFYIAHINIVLCAAPSKPALILIDDVHKTSFTFSWKSGIDPNNKITYDEFELDGEKSRKTSGLIKNVSFGNHEWKVRTCNEFCCSNFSANSFNAYNNPPSKPIANSSILSEMVVLNWLSGIDPEGDPTYDEFQLDGEIKKLKPPVIKSASGLIKWKVRTCDIYESCSIWNDQDSYTCKVINTTCPTPVLPISSVADLVVSVTSGGGGGGSGRGSGGSSSGGFTDIISGLVKQVFIEQIEPEIIRTPREIEISESCIEEKAKLKNLIYLLLMLLVLLILVIIWIIYKLNKEKQKIINYKIIKDLKKDFKREESKLKRSVMGSIKIISLSLVLIISSIIPKFFNMLSKMTSKLFRK